MSKNMMIPKNYPLYESSYGNDIPVAQYFTFNYGCIPSVHTNENNYDLRIFDFFKKTCVLHSSHSSFNRRNLKNESFLLVSTNKELMVKLMFVLEKNIKSYRVEYYYNALKYTLEEIVDWDEIKKYEVVKVKSNISLIVNEMGHLSTEEYDLNIPEMNIELNYGKSFINVHDTIVKRLNSDYDKGIILLHGDPGTGKTSYIKYLTGLIKNKEILFIPPSMAEILSEPYMIPFLLEHKNSILIIEDGEKVISDREINGSAAGVSNILNLTDGILGDCLGVQLIVTFNMKREKIDSALLRKGRLIAEHKFEKLSLDETNLLLKHLDKEPVTEGLTLSDIYNIDVELHKSETKNKIGFKK